MGLKNKNDSDVGLAYITLCKSDSVGEHRYTNDGIVGRAYKNAGSRGPGYTNDVLWDPHTI